MHPCQSSAPVWKALIACHLFNGETPVGTIECFNGMQQLTINAILQPNPPKLEGNHIILFRDWQSMEKDLCHISKISQTLKKNWTQQLNLGHQTIALSWLKNEEEKTFLHSMISDWKTRIENKGKTLAVKEKKRKSWQLINKMLFVNTVVWNKKKRLTLGK